MAGEGRCATYERGGPTIDPDNGDRGFMVRRTGRIRVDAGEAGPGPVSRVRGAHASGRDGVRELRGLCDRRGRRPAQPSLRARPRESPETVRGRVPAHEAAAGPRSERGAGEGRGRAPVHLHELRRFRCVGRVDLSSPCRRILDGNPPPPRPADTPLPSLPPTRPPVLPKPAPQRPETRPAPSGASPPVTIRPETSRQATIAPPLSPEVRTRPRTSARSPRTNARPTAPVRSRITAEMAGGLVLTESYWPSRARFPSLAKRSPPSPIPGTR